MPRPVTEQIVTESQSNEVEELKLKVKSVAKKLKTREYDSQILQNELLVVKDSFAKAQLEVMASD
jgi:hypothetical protein